jgi:hypothetical protein
MISGTVILGAIEQPRKARTCFIMSVCPSIRMNQHGSHWMHFREISYWDFYKNLSRNSKFGSNRANVWGTLHED